MIIFVSKKASRVDKPWEMVGVYCIKDTCWGSPTYWEDDCCGSCCWPFSPHDDRITSAVSLLFFLCVWSTSALTCLFWYPPHMANWLSFPVTTARVPATLCNNNDDRGSLLKILWQTSRVSIVAAGFLKIRARSDGLIKYTFLWFKCDGSFHCVDLYTRRVCSTCTRSLILVIPSALSMNILFKFLSALTVGSPLSACQDAAT